MWFCGCIHESKNNLCVPLELLSLESTVSMMILDFKKCIASISLLNNAFKIIQTSVKIILKAALQFSQPSKPIFVRVDIIRIYIEMFYALNNQLSYFNFSYA